MHTAASRALPIKFSPVALGEAGVADVRLRPDLVEELTPIDHPASVLDEIGKESENARFEPDLFPVFPQLAGAQVEIELPERIGAHFSDFIADLHRFFR